MTGRVCGGSPAVPGKSAGREHEKGRRRREVHNDMKEIHTSRRFFHTWPLKETQNHVSGNLSLCFLNPNPKDAGSHHLLVYSVFPQQHLQECPVLW